MEQHVEHLLGEYYDHELDARRHAQVEAHLASCASCRAALGRMNRLSEVLADHPVPTVSPEAFRARVMLRIARRSRRPRGNWVWYAVPVGLSSAIVLLQMMGAALLLLLTVMGWGGTRLFPVLASFRAGWPWFDWVLSWGWNLLGLTVYVSLLIVILLILIPYAGWVGLLWRSMRAQMQIKQVG